MVAKLKMDIDVEKHLGIVNYKVEPNFIEKFFSGVELPFHYFIESYVHHAITISIIYCLTIYAIQSYMQHRPGYKLRYLLALWNALLAIFSWMGAFRTLPELLHVLKHHGIHHTVCHTSYFYGPVGVWTIAFCLSKPIELVDTLFIVFRKQKLIFLHWYHHVTVMIYCWYGFPSHHGGGRVFMVMNYLVHSVMYTYYTLRTLRVRMPQCINITITTMQLTQMFIGALVNIYVVSLDNKARATYCIISNQILYLGIAIYLSYILLFANFFYNTYIITTTTSSDSTNYSDQNNIESTQNSNVEGYISDKKDT